MYYYNKWKQHPVLWTQHGDEATGFVGSSIRQNIYVSDLVTSTQYFNFINRKLPNM